MGRKKKNKAKRHREVSQNEETPPRDPLEEEIEEEAGAPPEKDGDEEGEGEQESARGLSFGEKFVAWRDGLADEVDKISIYVYQLVQGSSNKIPKRVQAYAFTIARTAEPPETHDIGIIVGEGDFEIVARARGREIMRKSINFGPVYGELKAERLQQKAAAPATGVVTASDPFASLGKTLDSLKPLLTPLVSAVAAAFNPMESMRRISAMGNQMAQDAFDFKLEAAKKAAATVTARHREEEDEGEDPPERSESGSRPNWEEKLSDLADLLMWKGRKFLAARGDEAASMRKKVEKKILNDSAFQALLQNPTEFKKAYSKLCKDCSEIGGAETVGAILKKLGIEPPIILPRNAPKRETAPA